MEFRQVLYYDAVYRNSSISKAAQELFVTQQCVSKQISMLEKELGVNLLVRRQNGVVPTEEGRWFHEHASMILQIEQDIQIHYEMARRNGPNVLRIGVSNGLNLFFDDIFFQRLREAHPELTIQVFYMWNRQIEDMLENGTIAFSNYRVNQVVANGFTARPYELRVYLFDPEQPKDPYEGLRRTT